MPVSKPSRRKRTSHGREAPPSAERVTRRWRKRVGWPLVGVGGVMFLLGNIGARTGITILPFDPHHVIAQFGGAVVLIVGLLSATAR